MYRSKYRQVLQKMRGISVQTFGEPSVLKYVEDLKKPEPAAKQVLIKIRAAGVNPVETYIRSGQFPGLPQLPYTPGTDGAGIVEAIGKDVEKFKVGLNFMNASELSFVCKRSGKESTLQTQLRELTLNLALPMKLMFICFMRNCHLLMVLVCLYHIILPSDVSIPSKPNKSCFYVVIVNRTNFLGQKEKQASTF